MVQRTYEIIEIQEETPRVKSFIFEAGISAEPGQFLMVWVPGAAEVPMSVSYLEDRRIGISVFERGETTKKLHTLKAGDFVGLRGPYGTFFKPSGKNVALVGGGCGIAPLGFFAESLFNEDIKVHVMLGAGTKKDLLFLDRLENIPYADVHAATEDGSYGHEGFVTELLEEVLKHENIDCVYTCGPEKMMYRVLEICKKNNIELQASLDRFMKCGVGICGSCALDGYLVCKDGPVFDLNTLKKMKEFGKGKMDQSGCMVDLK